MGNQPRISYLEEAYLILSLSSSSSSSETQGQSVGSREKARRKFHGKTGMLLLIASEMFSQVIVSSFVSG